MKKTKHKELTADRQKWIRVLANAHVNELKSAYQKIKPEITSHYIIKPETGLLMVQGKADGSHTRFSLGEVSVSKCVLRVQERYLGYGMVMGSDLEHAKLVALFDGLLQHPDYHKELHANVIQKLARQQDRDEKNMETEVADTRVDFFTLKRGE